MKPLYGALASRGTPLPRRGEKVRGEAEAGLEQLVRFESVRRRHWADVGARERIGIAPHLRHRQHTSRLERAAERADAGFRVRHLAEGGDEKDEVEHRRAK